MVWLMERACLLVSGDHRTGSSFEVAMATSSITLLKATPGPVAQMRSVSPAYRNEMHTTLRAPATGGVRGFGVGRNGHGVCVRKVVLHGFRAQSGIRSCDPHLI